VTHLGELVRIEIVLWGVVPAVVAVCCIATSLVCTVRRPSGVQALLSLLSITFGGLSLYVLKEIFLDGAWPTFLPHVGIGASVVVAVVQVMLHRGWVPKHERPTGRP
jgi:hypothetical protein